MAFETISVTRTTTLDPISYHKSTKGESSFYFNPETLKEAGFDIGTHVVLAFDPEAAMFRFAPSEKGAPSARAIRKHPTNAEAGWLSATSPKLPSTERRVCLMDVHVGDDGCLYASMPAEQE